MEKAEAIVVGGGLAGLTAALSLAMQGVQVIVIEKSKYPKHRVCGEYVSNEVRPLLEALGLNLEQLGAKHIDTLVLSATAGKSLSVSLPLGGFGISRYTLDHALYLLAVNAGVQFRFETAVSVDFEQEAFRIATNHQSYETVLAIGAYGKRSNMDKSMQRSFMQKKSPWLGVKCHYSFPGFQENHVELHNFPGGYGGLSSTEDGHVNFCYLVNYSSFKPYSAIEDFTGEVVTRNPHLANFLENASPRFDKPLSIAQISFAKKQAVENHMLMCGDSAGLIHPLCGNGMAMAIHAGKIAADIGTRFLKQQKYSREDMEQEYRKQWRSSFSTRLFYGRQIQSLMLRPDFSQWAIKAVANHKKIVQAIVQRTHGKPILV